MIKQQVGKEFTSWMEAQGYWRTGSEYDWDAMADAFTAGWQAALEADR